MAVKKTFRRLEKGELVAIKKPKQRHFDLGSAGPLLVLEDLGDSVKLQAMNGRAVIHNKANIIKLNAHF